MASVSLHKVCKSFGTTQRPGATGARGHATGENNLHGKVGGELLCVRLHQRLAIAEGQAVPLGWPLARLHVFDTASGLRLPSATAGAAQQARAA